MLKDGSGLPISSGSLPLCRNQQEDVTFTFRRAAGAGLRTQVDALTEMVRLDQGDSISPSFDLFAGPKEVDVLLDYNESAGIERLDHAIDWGWFPFLTKPFFHALNWMNSLFGNFGLAIIGLTVIVKLVFFPLANRSYKSMAKMRELAPKVQELRERFGDDKQRQQQEMMQLYRAEKVNPAAGCLPIFCRSLSSLRFIRCCSSTSRCVMRRFMAGLKICQRLTRPLF